MTSGEQDRELAKFDGNRQASKKDEKCETVKSTSAIKMKASTGGGEGEKTPATTACPGGR